jgi:hypothetical protein
MQDHALLAFNVHMGLMVNAAVHVAVQLRLADHLRVPKTVEELAQETGTHAPTLFCLLRALVHIGIFEEIDEHAHRFANTQRSRLLCSGTNADLIMSWGTSVFWNSWRDLLFTLQTGKPALQKQHGKQAMIQLRPEERQAFQRGQTANASILISLLLEAYDFSSVQHIVDVGGGNGLLAYALLRTYPDLWATLFDRNAVIEQAHLQLPKDVAARCALVPGNFFEAESLPQGADCYVLKDILENWDDQASKQILASCRKAMRKGGRVLVIEPVLSEQASLTAFLALQTRIMMGARTYRSIPEHRALFEAAGLYLIHTRLLGMDYAILVGQA